MDRKLQNLLGRSRKIPSRYAVEDLMAAIDVEELDKILVHTGRTMKRNKVLRRNSMDGRVVAAIDGSELFGSTKKKLPGALHRTHGNGAEEDYSKSVVAMTVGGTQKVILGQVMLRAGDGSSKAEGELTAAHRLLDKLYADYGRFCDIVVLDALYLNAPLLKHTDGLGIKAVVRLKGGQRLLYKDYRPLFDRDMYRGGSFETEQFTVSVWDCPDAEMADYGGAVRLLRFREQPKKARKDVPASRDMWVVTTEMDAPPRQIWQIMHQRWDIELNGFHQLKTFYHADHCFCRLAVEQFFLTALIAFNLREAYLFGLRARDVPRLGVTRRDLTEFFRNDLEVYPLGLFPHERCGRRKRQAGISGKQHARGGKRGSNFSKPYILFQRPPRPRALLCLPKTASESTCSLLAMLPLFPDTSQIHFCFPMELQVHRKRSKSTEPAILLKSVSKT